MNRSSSDFKSQAESKKLEELTEQIREKQLEITQIAEAPSYKKYSEILNENVELKAELRSKNTIIERLKAEVDNYKTIAEDLGKKLTMIAQKAGNQLMKLFGIDSPTATNEFPSKEVSAGIKEMTEGLKSIDFRQCRVIPDPDHIGKYRVAVKGLSGQYRTIKGGFDSRDLAERYRRILSENALEQGEHLKDGIKY